MAHTLSTVENRHILLVEDDTTIAEAVAARLRAEGFTVETAADGPSAVERFAARRPDLIVLDIMLPGFDGLEVCRRVQAVYPVPVVMLTARNDETDLLVGLGIGADDYLTKPFSVRERGPSLTSARCGWTALRAAFTSRVSRCTSPRPNSTCCTPWRTVRELFSPGESSSTRSGDGRTPPRPAQWTARSRHCGANSAPSSSAPYTVSVTRWR